MTKKKMTKNQKKAIKDLEYVASVEAIDAKLGMEHLAWCKKIDRKMRRDLKKELMVW